MYIKSDVLFIYFLWFLRSSCSPGTAEGSQRESRNSRGEIQKETRGEWRGEYNANLLINCI